MATIDIFVEQVQVDMYAKFQVNRLDLQKARIYTSRGRYTQMRDL